MYGPFLVAAPLSTVYNWVAEIKKFTPDMPVLLYHGKICFGCVTRNFFD
jgi:ATP-dependent DNA helicase